MGSSLKLVGLMPWHLLLNVLCIYDFRSSDLSYGGQGAPILPYSEEVLFPGYDGYLNLGGIANLNMPKLGLAFDIAPCNQIINHMARQLGHEYDRNGQLSQGGQVIRELSNSLMR